jgi:general stress protein YciG
MSPERRSELGRKGGQTISQDKAHMSRIGKLGRAAQIQTKNKT